MERITTSSGLRSKLSTILDEVQFKRDSYVIERKGKQAAAIVPIHVYEKWKRERERFFELLSKGQEGNEQLEEDDAMQIVLDAQAAIRKENSE